MSIPASQDREKHTDAPIPKAGESKCPPKKPVPPKIIVFREGTDPKQNRTK